MSKYVLGMVHNSRGEDDVAAYSPNHKSPAMNEYHGISKTVTHKTFPGPITRSSNLRLAHIILLFNLRESFHRRRQGAECETGALPWNRELTSVAHHTVNGVYIIGCLPLRESVKKYVEELTYDPQAV